MSQDLNPRKKSKKKLCPDPAGWLVYLGYQFVTSVTTAQLLGQTLVEGADTAARRRQVVVAVLRCDWWRLSHVSCDWSTGQQTPGDARAVTRSRGHAEAGAGQTPAHPHQAPGGHVSRLSSHACISVSYCIIIFLMK